MSQEKRIPISTCGKRSTCPLANTLDLIGDKWTLVVIRDMIFVGKKQFGDFLESPEGISTNILNNRLKRLEKYGLIYKRPYQKNPVRYEYILTKIGHALKPGIMAIAQWGLTYIEGTRGPTEKELKTLKKRYSRGT